MSFRLPEQFWMEAATHSKLNYSLVRQVRCAYTNMKRRCYNPDCREWKHYGGRGIRVCQRWLMSKIEFYRWAIENGCQAGLSLDRIDVNGDYSPENCRFADYKTQNNNTRRNRAS